MTETVTALRLLGDEMIEPTRSGGELTQNLAMEQVSIGAPGPGEVLVEPLYA
ncbi:MAG: hypothetical protein ACJAQ3_003103, partial [Planctomycetota bacterium]